MQDNVAGLLARQYLDLTRTLDVLSSPQDAKP